MSYETRISHIDHIQIPTCNCMYKLLSLFRYNGLTSFYCYYILRTTSIEYIIRFFFIHFKLIALRIRAYHYH